MSTDATTIVALWRREFGAEAEWYLRRKIVQLEHWGDSEGADLYRRALRLCRAASVSQAVRGSLSTLLNFFFSRFP